MKMESLDQSEVQRVVGLSRLRKPARPLIPRGDIPQGPFYITDNGMVGFLSWKIEESVLQPFVITTSWKPIDGYVRNQFFHILCSVYVATDMVSILRRIRNLETEYIPLCPWYVCSFCHPKKLGKDYAVDDPKRHDCYGFTIEEALDYIQQEGAPKKIGDTFNCKDHEPPSTDEPRMQRRKRGIKVRPIATLEEALKLLPTRPIGASLIGFKELFEQETKTYYGPRTEYSEFQGYHAVLIVAVEEYHGEIVALCKISNDTKVGDEGYVRVSLSTMYLVLGVDEEIQKLVQGNSEPVHLLSQFVALELDDKDDEKEDKKRKEMPEEKPEDKQYPHVSNFFCFGHA